METLTEYRKRKAREYLRLYAKQHRESFWKRKAELSKEELSKEEQTSCTVHFMQDYV